MQFLFSGLFWGLLLVLIGLSFILKSIFHIDIPVARIVFAIILIYWGVTLITHKKHKMQDNMIMFKDANIHLNVDQNEKTILFGSGRIDLTDIDLSDGNYRLDVNIVFGSGVIYIPENIPAIIKVSAVFGEVKLPDGTTEVFGDSTYKTDNFDKDQPYLKLDLDVVFGSGVVIRR